MSSWVNKPPTYQEWKDAKNHGTWWVKFVLAPKTTELCEDGGTITWSEIWFTDVVTIGVQYENGKLLDPKAASLHARGHVLGDFDLDDREKTDGLYWQPVVPPKDDIKDERPKV
jgi:hypothetical protein